METVNQHFGSAKSFAVYAVDMENSELMEAASLENSVKTAMKTSCPSRLTYSRDCAAVYCQAIGGSAINQLILKNIQPVKVHEGSKIKDLIVDLQNE